MSKDYTNIPRVRIFPEGEDKYVAHVLFPSKEIKEKYINDEYRFCSIEEAAYMAARTTEQRRKTKIALMAKRVLFAQKQGFGPKKNDKTAWVRQVRENNEVA